MGRVVGGFATSHVLFAAAGVESQASRVFAGMMALREAVKRTEPDVVVIANSDHMNNFTLANQVTLAVGVADSFEPLGDMGLPPTSFAGCRPLAERFGRHAAAHGFDLVQVEEARPDHGMMLTKLVAAPDAATPVTPVWINTNMPLTPSPMRAFGLGRVLKETVEAPDFPFAKVAVVAGGGLSHWLCAPEEGRVNEAFDRHFLETMAAGRSAELARMSVEALEAEAGNGGLELANWLFMAGALPHAKGEILYYEAMPQWITGMGGLALWP